MKLNKYLIVVLVVILVLAISGCSTLGMGGDSESEAGAPSRGSDSGIMGQGMGPGSGMMSHNMGDRHHAEVPDEFAGLTNPIAANDASLARGAEIYQQQCATCHGDFGNGDGPGGAALDPAPAPIAHTGQMMSDAYLFWRITEGGAAFETGMIPYRDILDENERWDVINYVRALGRGEVEPGQHMGGVPFDPAQEEAQRAEMLAQAVESSVISDAEADMFDRVHSKMDEYLTSESASGMETGSRADALPQILQAMVGADLISQDQADTFLDVHDRLIDAGLMQ